jgi:MoaA/NifB/PqqE/SkfB family radical SAM enzyme
MNPLAPKLIDRMKKQNRRLNLLERRQKITNFVSCPPVIQIEPTNRCNQSCDTCARNFYDESINPPADFPEELFEKIEPAFAFADTILFGGYGEPLMGENFDLLLGLAQEYKCRTEMITNGSLIDSETSEFLCGMGLDRVIVSIDAASDAELLRLRGISLTELMERLYLLREVGGLNAPEIAFNVTLHLDNLEQLKPLMSLAQTLEVVQVNVAHQKIYSASQAPDSVFHHLDHAEVIFAEVMKMAREQQIDLQLPPLEGTRDCVQPQQLMMVASDGRVQGCCSALFQGPGPKIALGSLWKDDLLALWNHPILQQARAAAYGDGDWPAPCEQCAFRVAELESHLRFLDEGSAK